MEEDGEDEGTDQEQGTESSEIATTSKNKASTDPPAASPRPQKKSQKRKSESIDSEMLNMLGMMAQEAQKTLLQQMSANETVTVADDCSHFAEALAITLRRLPPYRKALAKVKIQQVMLEIEFGGDALGVSTPCTPSASVGNAYRALYE